MQWSLTWVLISHSSTEMRIFFLQGLGRLLRGGGIDLMDGQNAIRGGGAGSTVLMEGTALAKT